MRKEVKDILQLLLLILPMFGITVFGWLHSPMYADVIEKDRLAAQIYLVKTYFFRSYFIDEERQAMMEHYGFTEEDIHPTKIFKKWEESRYNRNLGGSE